MKTRVNLVVVNEILCIQNIEIMDYNWFIQMNNEQEPINADIVDVHELYTLFGILKTQPEQGILEF